MKITFATYNIASGIGDGNIFIKNYKSAAEVIKSIGADVITLNEVGKRLPKDIPEHTQYLADYCGYEYHTFAKASSFGKYPFGNAILSRYPIENNEITVLKKFVMIAPGIYEPRCILSCEIAAEKRFSVICTHLGLLPDEQRLGIAKAAEIIKKSNFPVIMSGDLNLKSGSKLLLPLKSLVKDVCEVYSPGLKTFPTKKPQKRLDYILVSDIIRIEKVSVLRKNASDHLPLTAELFI